MHTGTTMLAGMLLVASHVARAANAAPAPLASELGADEPVNTGQDVTNPVKRIDIRGDWIHGVGGSDAQLLILRHDRPFALSGGNKFSARIDLPFVINDVVTPQNLSGDRNIGLSDVLLQGLFIHPVNKAQAFGIGAQLIIPTAGQDRFGGGKWKLVPTAGYRWALPSISKGSFFVAAARYAFDFAGDSKRPGVSVLQFGPTLNFALPNAVFFSLYPSTDIQYDFNHNSFFLPVDAIIGKLWSGGIVTSLEGAVAVIDDQFAPYKWKFEARIGLFF